MTAAPKEPKKKYNLSFPFLEKLSGIEHRFFLHRDIAPRQSVKDLADITKQTMPDCVEMKQIHGNIIHEVENIPVQLLYGDGLITARKMLWISVHTADCVPCFLIDEKLRAVSILHCGWRPVAEGIIEKALEKLSLNYGIMPSDLIAFCAPSIMQKTTKLNRIRQILQPSSIKKKNGKLYLDIVSEIRKKLTEKGLKEKNFDFFPVSTFREPSFESFRRDGDYCMSMTAMIRLVEA
jgi:YfiH family protein